MVTRTLSAIDYALLILLLSASAIIGVIFGFIKSKKSSAKEFLLGIHFDMFFHLISTSIFSLLQLIVRWE